MTSLPRLQCAMCNQKPTPHGVLTLVAVSLLLCELLLNLGGVVSCTLPGDVLCGEVCTNLLNMTKSYSL